MDEVWNSFIFLHLLIGSVHSINIFIWAVALLAHAACKSFGALFAVRFILGMCEGQNFALFIEQVKLKSLYQLEGAITPGFMIVTSMFYTRDEQTQRTGSWCKYSLFFYPTLEY